MGFNTDGTGALSAIEKKGSVLNRCVLIIGAGGAARAIAFEAMKRRSRVVILNRDVNRAEMLASALGCKWGGVDDLLRYYRLGYDFLIQCTPASMPIDPQCLYPGAIVMDLTTFPKTTALLNEAKLRGCGIVYGYEMFIEQAIGQFNLWFIGFDSWRWKGHLESRALQALADNR